MSLYDTKKDLTIHASYLPKIIKNGVETNRYEDYHINVLADGFCKARDEENEFDTEMYLSALILRFWSKINKMYQAVKTYGFSREDCFDRLYDCMMAACDYKAWQDPDRHTNAESCINQVITCRGIPAMIYEANLQKNTKPIFCLDTEIDGDNESSKLDTVEDTYKNPFYSEAVYSFVQNLIDKNKVVEAIIADTVAYNDCEKHKSVTVKEVLEDGQIYKYSKQTSKVWDFQIIKKLNEIGNEYSDYFYNTYTIKPDILKAALADLNKASNQKKYSFLAGLRSLRATFTN